MGSCTVSLYHYGPFYSIERGLFLMPVYKDEKRGTWFVSCYYTNWMGERKQKRKRGFQRQKDAVAWEREFLTKEAGSPDMSFSSMCALYLEDAKARIRPTSYVTKCGIFRKRILPYFKDKPVNAITPADIRAWQNRMISEKADPVRPAAGASPRALSQSYLKTVSNQLSAVFTIGTFSPSNRIRRSRTLSA